MGLSARAFTLLEVLIAVAIFAISASIVYGLYASMMSVVYNVEERTGKNDQVRMAFARINRDLSGLYRGEPGYLKGRDSAASNADEPILEVVSRTHLSFDFDADPVPLSVIRYYIVPEEQDETYALLRSDSPASLKGEEAGVESSEARTFTLCGGLAEVRISYLSRDGDENDEWDTTEGSDEEQKEDSRFPSHVRIELLLPTGAGGEGENTVYSTAVLLRAGLITFDGESSG